MGYSRDGSRLLLVVLTAALLMTSSQSKAITNGTIVHKASGQCVTAVGKPPSPHPHPRPPRPGRDGPYQPMRKQGAIILATGGDQSNRAEGNFYEGFMATGYASAETDAAVQANIVAVGYKNVEQWW